MDNFTPVEIERKYVIRMPDLTVLRGMDCYTVSEIEQTYLESEPHVTHRVRKRVYAEGAVYTETKKVRIDKISSYEEERQIDEAEYERLLGRIRYGTRTLTKTRHTFVFSGQTFEVDIYPEWKESCILETELSSRDTEVKMPTCISVIGEVSGDKRYTNASMAVEFPKEIFLI